MARLNRENRAVLQMLESIEKFLRITNNEFEMHFIGILKVPPKDKERELKRMFIDLRELRIQNTSLLFKARTLTARYNTLKMRWLRTTKQIENGTYHRQRVMADRREKDRQAERGPSASEIREQIRSMVRGESVAEARPQAAGGKSTGHKVGSDDLFKEFKEVRRQLGKDDDVNRKALEKQLKARADKVKKDYGYKKVTFRVVAENGRSRIKVIPEK